MEKFVVSARKYRPVKFEEVVGQEGVTTTLQNAIKNNQTAHAYLFCGPRGVGKTTCARILAREVNEFKIDESGESSTSLNIYELDAASNNSVDDIRSLVEQVRIPPQYGKYKVYIIDEVHMLSQSAFNAFLKTLEEPPPYAIFILATTEKQKILPTILSRCQIFDFNRITIDDIKNHLGDICKKEGIDADDNALHIIAQKADGALRDALSMFDRLVNYVDNKLTYESVLTNLNILDYDYYFRVTDCLLTQDQAGLFLVYDEILKHGFDGSDFITGLEEHFRNLMVCKNPQTVNLLEVTGDLKKRYEQQAEHIPSSYLLSCMNISNACEISYKTSNSKRLHVELALLKMCYLPNVIEVEESRQPAELPKKKSTPEPRQANELNGNLATKAEKQAPSGQPSEPKPTQVKKKQKETETALKENSEKLSEQKEEPEQGDKVKLNEGDDREQQAVVKEENTEKSYPVGLKKKIDLEKLTGNVKLSELEADEEEEEQVEDETEGDHKVNIEIDRELFDKAWKSYLKKLEEENRKSLRHVMLVIEPVLDGGAIKLILENKLQKELFENERGVLLEYLEQQLNVKGLSMVTKVNKKKAKKIEKKPFTQTEKFKKMVEKNPAILTLKEKLDLKLEY